MSTSIRLQSLTVAVAGLVWLSAQAPPLAGQGTTGIVAGTVVDATTRRPLSSVQVLVLGTRYGTLTDAAGTYRIPNVPAGPVQVQARLIGYGAVVKPATVQPGQITN